MGRLEQNESRQLLAEGLSHSFPFSKCLNGDANRPFVFAQGDDFGIDSVALRASLIPDILNAIH